MSSFFFSKSQRTILLSIIVTSWIVSGCQSAQNSQLTPAGRIPSTSPAPTQTVESTTRPTGSVLPLPASTPSPTLEVVTGICSPLADIDLSDLHSITSQAFRSPTAFQDDGHPAVDLAFFTFEDFPTMIGHPVQAILPGTIVEVLDNRFPFGNSILIETQLDQVSESMLSSLLLPTPIPDENITLFDPCTHNPAYEGLEAVEMSAGSRSLYTLYAHLLTPPDFEEGDRVSCGQTIGAVGNTGNSVAEHLHLEVRIGPSHANFGSLAMFQPDATAQERYNYCIWSISGRFQAIDPAIFWQGQR